MCNLELYYHDMIFNFDISFYIFFLEEFSFIGDTASQNKKQVVYINYIINTNIQQNFIYTKTEIIK